MLYSARVLNILANPCNILCETYESQDAQLMHLMCNLSALRQVPIAGDRPGLRITPQGMMGIFLYIEVQYKHLKASRLPVTRKE